MSHVTPAEQRPAAGGLVELLVADAGQWRAWLEQFGRASAGVWLVLHKKGGAVTTLTYDQALDEALCFGWIDGQLAGRDDQSYRQRFTPRRARSSWSARNVGIVERLSAAGRMRPAGQAAVEAARADGRWAAAYSGQAARELPTDLAAALAADPVAAQRFAALSSANRYAFVYRLQTAARPETRARRLAQTLAMLADGTTHHPQA